MERHSETLVKMNFVKELGELYAKNRIQNVIKMEYEDDGLDEIVTVTFTNGYKKRICVTLDSLAAINQDIIRGIF